MFGVACSRGLRDGVVQGPLGSMLSSEEYAQVILTAFPSCSSRPPSRTGVGPISKQNHLCLATLRSDSHWDRARLGGNVVEAGTNGSLEVDLGLTRRAICSAAMQEQEGSTQGTERGRASPIDSVFSGDGKRSVTPRNGHPLRGGTPAGRVTSMASKVLPVQRSDVPELEVLDQASEMRPHSTLEFTSRCQTPLILPPRPHSSMGTGKATPRMSPRCGDSLGNRARMAPTVNRCESATPTINHDNLCPPTRSVGSRSSPTASDCEATGVRHTSSFMGSGQLRRANLVKWCFRHPREQVSARLELLSHVELQSSSIIRSEPGPDGSIRYGAYCPHVGSPQRSSEIGKVVHSYEYAGIKRLPQIAHPSSIDSWSVKEGGCARTSELVSAFALINFYRWLCGVPRLKLDSFHQELADLILQTYRRRDSRIPVRPHSINRVKHFMENFVEFTQSDLCRAMVVLDMPSSVGAVHHLFAGLPMCSDDRKEANHLDRLISSSVIAEDITAFMNKGATIKACTNELIHRLREEDMLWPYRPLLWSGKPIGKFVEESDEASNGAFTVPQRPAHRSPLPSRPAPLGGRSMRRPPVSGGELREEPSVDLAVQKRKVSSDILGNVTLRRCVLDPRVRRTGLVRRGCRVCIWTATHIPGAPDECRTFETLLPHFLDPEPMEESQISTKAANVPKELMKLQRWREQVSRRIECASKTQGFSLTSDETLSDFGKNFAQDFAMLTEGDTRRTKHRERIRQVKTLERGNSLNVDRLKELQRNANCTGDTEIDLDEGENQVPVMVCFPPPGIVPLEFFNSDAALWTVSPDPGRFVPTTECEVRVFRIRLQIDASEAERLPGGEVPLASFRVDCSSAGTPFCIIFSLATQIENGDQFEVQVCGLACRLRELPQDVAVFPATTSERSSNVVLRYFVSFETFQPGIRDKAPLQKRADEFNTVWGASHIWASASWDISSRDHGPDLDNDHDYDDHMVPIGEEVERSRSGVSRHSHHSHSMQRKSMSRRSTTSKIRHDFSLKRRKGKHDNTYSAQSPPSFGVVPHPDAVRPPRNGCYELQCKCNEITLALTIPRTVLVKANLMNFVKSQAKWDIVPNAVSIMYFDEYMGNKDGPCYTRRAVFRMLFPFPGTYELHVFWTYAPQDATLQAGLNPVPSQLEHPLSVHVEVASEAASLVPTIYHGNMRRFGFPKKHPLADHFGVALLGPLRYRLRPGYVRFSVYVKQSGDIVKTEVGNKAVVEASRALEAKLDENEENLGSSIASDETDYDAPRQFSNGLGEESFEELGEKPFQSSNGRASCESLKASRQGSLTSRLSLSGEDQSSMSANDNAVFLDTIPYCAQNLLRNHASRGSEADVVIAAVVGTWRRVEVLSRLTLEPPPLPPELEGEMAATEGSAVLAAAAARVADAWRSDVHEAVVHLTEEDRGQSLQLVVFQVAAASAFDQGDYGVGADPAQTQLLPPKVPSGETSTSQPAHNLGTLRPPCRWILAEFHVDEHAAPLPYDEDEMAKPPAKRTESKELGEIQKKLNATRY